MFTSGSEVFGPLLVLWSLPAAGALIALVATRGAPPATRRTVLGGVRLLLLAYIAGAAVLVLWPLHFDVSVARVENGNWTPLDGTIGFMLSDNPRRMEIGRRDVLANVVLFAPIGFLIPFAFYQWRGIVLAIATVGFLSFGLELAQGLTVAERTFDIDDAIAGLGGGAAGALVAGAASPLGRLRASRKAATGDPRPPPG